MSSEELAILGASLGDDFMAGHFRPELHTSLVAGDFTLGSAAVRCDRPEDVVLPTPKGQLSGQTESGNKSF